MSPDEAGPKRRTSGEGTFHRPDGSDAHLALAIEGQWYEWNWPTAEREFKRAIELNPRTMAHGYYFGSGAIGRGVDALAEPSVGSRPPRCFLKELLCSLSFRLHPAVEPRDRATAQ